MSDEEALILSILDFPKDDAPRLILSDWWDEHDQPERAEFCRVQCELAGLEKKRTDLFNDSRDWKECTEVSANWCPNCGDCSCPTPEDSKCDPGCSLHAPNGVHGQLQELCDRIIDLRARERELWSRKSAWLSDLSLSVHIDVTLPTTYSSNVAIVRRGFVDEVRVSVATFLGESCRSCEGRGLIRYMASAGPYGHEPDDKSCPRCEGTGRVAGIAESLFRAQPVLTVRLTDREPQRNRFMFEPDREIWCWWKGQAESAVWMIPPPLWDILANCKSTDSMDYPTAGAAHAALSTRACVAYGRRAAGLGAIS